MTILYPYEITTQIMCLMLTSVPYRMAYQLSVKLCKSKQWLIFFISCCLDLKPLMIYLFYTDTKM